MERTKGENGCLITRVLDELHETGCAIGENSERVAIREFALSHDSMLYLENAVSAVEPETILEVGCASAISTLAMARASGGARLHVMDPKQTSHWKNIGRGSIHAAGIQDRVRFHEDRADVVLPGLVADGVRAQFAFIDGWHMLDYVMVEAHYTDLMLDVGGLIAIHDLWMPGLQHFAAYWIANRAYEPVTMSMGKLTTDPIDAPLSDPRRELRSPEGMSAYFSRVIAPYVDRSLLLLRKTGADKRVWDAFFDFIA